MRIQTNYHPVVQNLVEMIAVNNWKDSFEKAIKNANSKNVPLLRDVKDLEQYLDWINEFLFWVPTETSSGQNVNDHLCAFYFIADQEPVLSLQNKVIPHDKAAPLSPFSKWMVDYAEAMGLFLDTPESLTKESEQTFLRFSGL